MKKTICFLLSLILICGLLPSAVAASNAAALPVSGRFGVNHTFTLDENGVMTVEGEGPMVESEEARFPGKEYTYGDPADIRRSVLRVAILPGTTVVGDGAFAFFTAMSEIVLPDTVTAIGANAFRYCVSLKELSLPEGLTELGEGAFTQCMEIVSVRLPEGIRELPAKLFQSCYSLEEVSLPAGLVAIGDSAFDECVKLNGVALPESLQRIGSSAFHKCRALTAVSVPDSVTELGGNAFSCCSSLSELSLGEGLTAIPDRAFLHCRSLTEISVPDSVSEIGPYAFCGCENVSSVYLPASVVRISKSAFYTYPEICLTTVRFGGSEEQWNAIEWILEAPSVSADRVNRAELKAEILFDEAHSAENLMFDCGPAVTPENLGDLDADGSVTASDARLTLRASVSLEHFGLFRTQKADLDLDGSVTAADARGILRTAVGLTDA